MTALLSIADRAHPTAAEFAALHGVTATADGGTTVVIVGGIEYRWREAGRIFLGWSRATDGVGGDPLRMRRGGFRRKGYA